jgi:hypothetical protein
MVERAAAGEAPSSHATPTSPTPNVESDISIGEAGDVSIGDLQLKVAENRFWKITGLRSRLVRRQD